MKKCSFPVLVALFVTSLFAEPSVAVVSPDPMLTPQPLLVQKQGFFYIRFTAGEHDIARAGALIPGFGLGYRRLAGDGAADLSFSGIGIAENKNSRHFWTIPKASYYHYLQPNGKKSFYTGGGLAWGGVEARGRRFIGIIPSVTLGYEFSHKASFLGFSELTVSQPALAVTRKGVFPGPISELSLGVGF